VKNGEREPTELAASFKTPTELADAASARDQAAEERVAGEKIHQQAALVIVHDPPRRSQEFRRLDDADGDWPRHAGYYSNG